MDNCDRPRIPSETYSRMMMVGYVEGIGSGRGVTRWRADSTARCECRGRGLEDHLPEHSTLSETRRLLKVDSHAAVFGRVRELVFRVGFVERQDAWCGCDWAYSLLVDG